MTKSRGERLLAAMKARRIPKLSVLAAALNVSESAVSRWCHDAPMTIDNVEALCRFLEISADWFLFGRGAMDPPGSRSAGLDHEWAEALQRMSPQSQRDLLRFLHSMRVED